jgi:hypothetical protein
MYLAGFPAEELTRVSGHKGPVAFTRYIEKVNFILVAEKDYLCDEIKP